MNELILIVEDEKDVAELLRYNLEKQGYRTIVAENGEQAITAVQCHETNLVLLDIMLPELNGWEVCQTLRASSKGKAIPVIMLTALSSEDDRIKGLALGADDYLTKPFSVRELLLKVRNILDKEQAMKSLLTREQERDTTYRYLVHELKNSVSVIGGFSTLAMSKGNSGNYLEHITSTALHMESLLNDASLLSRLEKAGNTLPVEPVQIDGLVEDVVDTFQEIAKNKGVGIFILNAASSSVTGNAGAVRQIMINLISNAVKYNRDGGKVWIFFNELDDRTDISVKDEGYGIPEDELPRVFEKFYRARGSEQARGSGLGLYVVKLLTRAMDGTVAVESRAGRGSTFSVSFKKADAARQSPQEAAWKEEPQTLWRNSRRDAA